MKFNKLFKKMQLIVGKKSKELKEWEEKDPGSIECPVLECEINDAEYIILIIHADIPHDHKLSGIKAIYKQTTSNSIYDAVREHFDKEEGIVL